MAQTKILVDTNSYLRLARSIHPLLFVEFGVASYCLYVITELDDELRRNPALQTKFHWALESEYVANRQKHPALSKTQRQEVKDAFDFLWNFVQTSLPGPSRVDARQLAYGYVLNIPVVTDDKDMRELANEFGIQTMASLGLLKVMLDCNHINEAKVREIYQYWKYWNDLPYAAADDYERLFGAPPE